MELKDTINVKSGLYIVSNVREHDGSIVEVLRPNPAISEEEFISRDPYAEMLEEASKKEQFDKTVNTQRMVNDYLKSENRPTITEMRAHVGKRDILGILTSDYKAVLQEMVRRYTIEKGINLYNSDQKKSGVMGVLSDKEKQVVDMLLQVYGFTDLEPTMEDTKTL